MSDFKPFDIITAPYIDFNGQIKTNFRDGIEYSLFFVVSVNEDNTLTCCKITSNKDTGVPACNYYLSLVSHPFLQCDSWIQCDKLHTVSAFKSIKRGSMIDFCRRGFISKFTLVFGQFRLGLEEYAPEYISPSRKF